MNRIREYAKNVGFNVVGNLKRMPNTNLATGESVPWWIDEANNEYIIDNGRICIITADGGII